MQHEFVLKMLNFDLLTPVLRVVGASWGGGGGLRENHIFYFLAEVRDSP